MNYSIKKKNKLNTYKTVRDNIRLNNTTKVSTDLPKNFINDNHLIYEFSEINLINHISAQKKGKKETLTVKWWEKRTYRHATRFVDGYEMARSCRWKGEKARCPVWLGYADGVCDGEHFGPREDADGGGGGREDVGLLDALAADPNAVIGRRRGE